MPFYFLSDLHLCDERPHSTAQLNTFLAGAARGADALYILGDLVEYWIGDDTLDHQPPTFIPALRAVADHGVPVYLMHGNRDFLLGHRFATACGAQLIADPQVISIYGEPTLLMHGDSLCTDDIAYQNFRREVRDPQWQAKILALPWAQRVAMAQKVRAESQRLTGEKPEFITDVNQTAVETAMRAHGVTRLIHGHTHRPAVHDFVLDQQPAQRIVLPDWYEYGGVLEWGAQDYRFVTLA